MKIQSIGVLSFLAMLKFNSAFAINHYFRGDDSAEQPMAIRFRELANGDKEVKTKKDGPGNFIDLSTPISVDQTGEEDNGDKEIKKTAKDASDMKNKAKVQEQEENKALDDEKKAADDELKKEADAKKREEAAIVEQNAADMGLLTSLQTAVQLLIEKLTEYKATVDEASNALKQRHEAEKTARNTLSVSSKAFNAATSKMAAQGAAIRDLSAKVNFAQKQRTDFSKGKNEAAEEECCGDENTANSPNLTSEDSDKDSGKDSGKDSSKDSDKESDKESGKDTKDKMKKSEK